MSSPLGRGLRSLIPKKEAGTAVPRKKLFPKLNRKESIFNIEVDKIKPNAVQPRRTFKENSLNELAASIKEHGILQPLLVVKMEKETDRGRDVEYELIAGERRWRAAKIAGLPRVPVIIKDSSAEEKLELALIENLQRQDLNPVEQALAFKQLHDEFGMTHQQIAEKVGKNRPTISNTVRFLNLPPKVQKALAAGVIGIAQAKAILQAKPELRIALFEKIRKEGLNKEEAEFEARKLGMSANRPGQPIKYVFCRKMGRKLTRVLGHPVNIHYRNNRGYMRIIFANDDELKQICSRFVKF